MKRIISPSMLSCDFANLAKEANDIIDKGADWLHMDVMDGHFVPNITLGSPVIKSLRKHTCAFLDCHLMVTNPENWIEDFSKAGASLFCFHLEATGTESKTVEVCKKIKEYGMKVGIAVKPRTAIELVLPYISMIDMVLIMTVEPGFGGQKFMSDMMPKVKWLRTQYPDLDIEVDGGISPETIDVVLENGANVIVSGSAIFGAANPRDIISLFKEKI